jgi:hypothetical protein
VSTGRRPSPLLAVFQGGNLPLATFSPKRRCPCPACRCALHARVAELGSAAVIAALGLSLLAIPATHRGLGPLDQDVVPGQRSGSVTGLRHWARFHPDAVEPLPYPGAFQGLTFRGRLRDRLARLEDWTKCSKTARSGDRRLPEPVMPTVVGGAGDSPRPDPSRTALRAVISRPDEAFSRALSVPQLLDAAGDSTY